MISRDILKTLPEQPGIYLFKDDQRIYYIGKAKDIRKRVSDHLSQPYSDRHREFIQMATRVDVIITTDERSALLLENTLIKKHQPPYNIMLKDDKTFPFLVLTITDRYPRIMFTRRIHNEKDRIFGPFASAAAARKTLRFVARHFQIRTCSLDMSTPLARPCLYYDMGECPGPCVPGLTDEASYLEKVREADLFLSGRDRELLSEIRKKISTHSNSMDYEKAALYRDLYHVIFRIREHKRVVDTAEGDLDLFALHRDRDNLALAVLIFRKGLLIDKREYFWEGENRLDGFYSAVLPQYYLSNPWIPPAIVLDHPPTGMDDLKISLSELRGRPVRITVPRRGPMKERLDMARENARVAFQKRFKGFITGIRGLEELERVLKLPPVRIIEAFDISHFRGKERLGALIVYSGGIFRKKDYRVYTLTESTPEDDVGGIHEMVMRRYRRTLKDGITLPDLILIDGGPSQVSAAEQALSTLSISVPVAGLAKREERVYYRSLGGYLTIDKSHKGLLLLRKIRDEVHRFGISRHRRKRSKTVRRSSLESLPGVGRKTAHRLLMEFHSISGLMNASIEEIQSILGPVRGLSIYESLHSSSWLE